VNDVTQPDLFHSVHLKDQQSGLAHRSARRFLQDEPIADAIFGIPGLLTPHPIRRFIPVETMKPESRIFDNPLASTVVQSTS
jgi:hypothetical protein